ncbi:hypothetical protein TNCV_3025851 [Trichonephila clavipes]|nr:hypothetical protein TNCV_3025851 [Trichonephila clavipes]
MSTKNTKSPNPESDLHPHARPPSRHGGGNVSVPHKLFGLRSSFISSTNYYSAVGTKNVKFSVILTNLLPVKFLKHNPKYLVGTVKYGEGGVIA